MAKINLTPLQERFKNNIISGMDAKTAYIEAGYRARGNAAEAAASRLLRNVKLKTAIKEAQQKAADKAEITQQRILEEESHLAFLNPKGLVDKNGKLLNLHELPENVARAIVALDVVKQNDGSLKYKYRFSDKGKSLERLERIRGMFAPEKHEIGGKDGGPIEKLTNFPSGPLTLAEWEKQVKELNAQKDDSNNQPDGDSNAVAASSA